MQKEEKIKFQQAEIEKRKHLLIHIGHDSMHPIIVIQNKVQRAIDTGSCTTEDLEDIQSHVYKLAEMMNSFFAYEQIEKGEIIHTHDTYIDLSKSLSQFIKTYDSSFAREKITVATDIKSGCVIKISPQALDEIVYNLFDNAVKHNREDNGTIEITLDSDEMYVILSVRNTGAYLTQEEIDALFLPYYERTNGKGGVGLSVINTIITQIHAQIMIESDKETGTIVIINFQKPTEENPKIVERTINIPLPSLSEYKLLKQYPFDAAKRNILIVEDHREFLAMMCNEMSPEFNIFYAENGEAALEFLKDITKPVPDLIISDIMMEKIDGHELYNRVRAIDAFRRTPIILITAKKDQADRIRALKSGIIDYILKPFLISDLILRVKGLLYNINNIFLHNYFTMMVNNRDQLMRSRNNDEFICFERICRKYNISAREKEVAGWYLQGLLAKEIAAKLGISAFTAKSHIGKLHGKCEVANKLEFLGLFKFYSDEIKCALNTNYQDENLIIEALRKDWRKYELFDFKLA